MKKIVVIGGGTMGLDIAQVFAKKGFDVVVRDINDDIIKASEGRLNKGLDKLVSKGKMDEAKKADILAHMTFTTDLNMAADADLVVRADREVFDRMAAGLLHPAAALLRNDIAVEGDLKLLMALRRIFPGHPEARHPREATGQAVAR